MSKLEVLWAPLFALALIAVESFFLRKTLFPLTYLSRCSEGRRT